MIFQSLTIPGTSITKPDDEWRKILADPQPFLDELRAALADKAADTQTRKNNFTLDGTRSGRVSGGAIASAAKQQNEKVAKRFLARNSGIPTTATPESAEHVCPECGKRFFREGNLRNHLEQQHPKALPAFTDQFVRDAD